MTRSDYIRLAAALRAVKLPQWREELDTEGYATWGRCCESVADAIARNNPKFDRALFMVNCGVVS